MENKFWSAGNPSFASTLVLSCGLAITVPDAAPQMMDYYMPTPIVGSLSPNCWGAAQTGPRDQSNGLEDSTLSKYVYWDGGILRGSDSLYYMFAARWDQTLGHNGWQSGSKAVWATSKNLYGPYQDKGYCFSDNGSAGHNVNVIKLKENDPTGMAYAMTLSGYVPGSGRVYGAKALGGPWSYLGNIKMDLNGYSGGFNSGDNFRVILRPDGRYMCLTGRIGISDDGILGPYKCQQAKDFTALVVGSLTANMEDPNLFYVGGKYHVLYNNWSSATAYSYSSADGVKFTLDNGFAYQPAANNSRYTNGAVNHWKLFERPFAYIENGHVVAFTFAAINSAKEDDKGNDKNGSKVIVVPFDGVNFEAGAAPGTVALRHESAHVPVGAIPVPGLGSFGLGDAAGFREVRFHDPLGKQVRTLPIRSGSTGRIELPGGTYLMTFHGDGKMKSAAYKVRVD